MALLPSAIVHVGHFALHSGTVRKKFLLGVEAHIFIPRRQRQVDFSVSLRLAWFT